LYLFTKKVIELYELTSVEDCSDVHQQAAVKEELKIKTHYESLDIAGSNKIHYLKFTLPAVIKNIDDQLQEQLRNEQPD
jgi:tRNA (guanine-N7-)-methyltransferase